MPSMTNFRLADLNLNYKLREILEDNGFTSSQYQVIDSYPNNIDWDASQVWPTVSVTIEGFFGRDVELGSGQWTTLHFAIDVFAKNDSQRDDLTYTIWKQLNEKSFTFYDFNSGFPTTVGDYSGITTIGDYNIENLTSIVIPPPAQTNIVGERHHALLDGLLLLSN